MTGRVVLAGGGHAGGGDDDFDAACGGVLGKLLDSFGRAVGREGVHLEGHVHVVQQLGGFLHDWQVGGAAHDDANYGGHIVRG